MAHPETRIKGGTIVGIVAKPEEPKAVEPEVVEPKEEEPVEAAPKKTKSKSK